MHFLSNICGQCKMRVKVADGTMQACNTNWGGRVSTVDLRIKVACSVKRKEYFQYKNEQMWTSEYKGANCTAPSPSVSIPWFKYEQDWFFAYFCPVL
jgi:hypothetical protein